MTNRAGSNPAMPATTALPAVAVAPATRADLFNEVRIPAEFRPYLEVELHAKVSGYLEQINVDFGDRVKAGQLLATLEAPDQVAQLNNALAALRRAEADYTNAHLIYLRTFAVNQQQPNAVAQQDVDTAAAKDQTAAAAIAAAKADVDKYQTLVNYLRITAPFDGVVTRRYADPGAFIQAGTTSAQSLPLVRISDNYRLRLDFPVSVAYVKDIHLEDAVEVRVESLRGKRFTGRIRRASYKVDEATRTMLTEIEVANPNLELVPGMYATVALRVQTRPHALGIPAGAVPPEDRGTVYVVDARGQVEKRAVVLGLETSTHYEVVSGLNEGELVMLGKWSQVKPGQTVEPKVVEPSAEE
jgi:RND family efflux transporter MFP subunit